MPTGAQLDGSINKWLLVFAAVCYFAAVVSLLRLGKSQVRAQMTVFHGCSKSTFVVCTLTWFIWGSVYLSRALGWRFAERYHLVIQIVPVVACAVCFGLDWLRTHLPRRF